MTAYRHGLVVGKFYPPHGGHELLIRTAAEGAARVTVVVNAGRDESIPLADRVGWLREIFADTDNVSIVGMPCDIPFDLDDGCVWTAQVALMRAAARLASAEPVDAVYSSEAYGDGIAERLGAVHVCVDVDRRAVPVSATACRADLPAMWDHLHPVVRAGLAVRVVVVGAESTGTTTVSRALADHYRSRGGVWARTGWVPEHGRDHTVEKWAAAQALASAAGEPAPGMDELVWTAEEFALIAARQTALEEAAARSGSPVLICDTDAFATSVWERRYLGLGSAATLSAAAVPRHDVYLLTDHVGVPFVRDGLRDGEHIRAEMTEWFIDALTAAGHSWVLLTGSLDERVRLAVRVTDRLVEARCRFTAPATATADPGRVLA
jgi:HTH-type transcriptional regulator, transcriptional repressor of NAD biosynthesis genes